MTESSVNEPKATLYVIAAPLGCAEDWSLRAHILMGKIDALACEDTRKTLRLLRDCGLQPPKGVFSCHEHNEEKAVGKILSLLKKGSSVGIITDAGVPCISDPGFRVVNAAIDADFPVVPIPGPSASIAALSISGLPSDSFVFLGYPPRKSNARIAFFEQEAAGKRTLVFFESPYRLGRCLADALVALADRRAALCFEISKRHERTQRAWLSQLAAQYADTRPLGEVTVVIAGKHRKYIRPLQSNGS